MQTLLEIGSEISELEHLLADDGGDITGREDEIDAWLKRTDMARDTKIDAYASLCSELTARAEIRETEAMRLSHRANVDANKARFLKGRLVQFFQMLGLRTVETARWRVTLARHGGRQPIAVHVAPEDLPEDLRNEKTVVKPDMDAIRLQLELHGDLSTQSGTPIASFKERGESIRIR